MLGGGAQPLPGCDKQILPVGGIGGQDLRVGGVHRHARVFRTAVGGSPGIVSRRICCIQNGRVSRSAESSSTMAAPLSGTEKMLRRSVAPAGSVSSLASGSQ